MSYTVVPAGMWNFPMKSTSYLWIHEIQSFKILAESEWKWRPPNQINYDYLLYLLNAWTIEQTLPIIGVIHSIKSHKYAKYRINPFPILHSVQNKFYVLRMIVSHWRVCYNLWKTIIGFVDRKPEQVLVIKSHERNKYWNE